MDNNNFKQLFDTIEPYLKNNDDIITVTNWKTQFEDNLFFEEIQKVPAIERLSAIFDGLVEQTERTILENHDLPEDTRNYLYAYKDLAKRFARIFATTERSQKYIEDNLKKLKEKLVEENEL